MIPRFLPGDTADVTWVWSGNVLSGLTYIIYDGSETVVDTGTMTNSGAGHYFTNLTVPTSTGFYVNQLTGTLSGKPYIRRKRFRVAVWEVD